jgi:ketosteroid isomerase-like protein
MRRGGWSSINPDPEEIAMKADPKTEREVLVCLDAFLDAYTRRRAGAAMARMVQDPDLVLYGTGADEKRVGPAEAMAQMERDWSQSDASTFAIGWSQVSAAGPVAWVSTDGAFRFRVGGQEMTLPARASFVLEQRDGAWLIAHAHFSAPAASQDSGQSF